MPSFQSRSQIERERYEGFIAFKSDDSVSVLLHIPGISDKHEGQLLLDQIVKHIQSQEFSTAVEFDTKLSEGWMKLNMPLTFSLAILFHRGEKAFLKTHGQGRVSLTRNAQEVELVKDAGYAAGIIQSGDSFGLYVNNLVGDTTRGVVVFDSDHIKHNFPKVEEKSASRISTSTISRLPTLFQKYSRKQITTILALFLIGVVLFSSLRSVFFSKTSKADYEQISYAKELIMQKLAQADDVVSLNTGRAVALIVDAKKDLQNLEKKLNGRKKGDVKKLAELIAQSEKTILKKNHRGATEFFDLSLAEKNAVGEKAWIYGDKIIILNSKGAIYIFSVERKSLDTVSISQLVNASLAGLDEEAIYVFKKSTGILRFETSETKPEVIIKPDREWGSITDMQVFNKNLYLLDNQKGQIYKYVPTENGFASISAYFKSGAYAKGANSIAIDQSIYVAQSDLVTKYTGGLQDGFAPQYPDRAPTITRVLADVDSDFIYLWDKNHATLISLSKSGIYESEIESPILSKASSVVVYKNSAYALQGSKIYQILLK